MLRSGYASLGLVVSLFLVLVVGTRPSQAQTGPASWAVAAARGAPTAAAAGEQSRAADVNNIMRAALMAAAMKLEALVNVFLIRTCPIVPLSSAKGRCGAS